MPPSRKSTSTHYDSGSSSRSYSSRGGRSSGRLTIFDRVIRLPEFPAFVMEQMQKKSDTQKAYEETAFQDSY